MTLAPVIWSSSAMRSSRLAMSVNSVSGTIGHAALKAIEGFQGREGMDILMDPALDHFFASVREEAVLVAERLTGQRWYLRRPNERADWHIKEVKEWWKQYRESFLREHPPLPEK